MSDSLFKGYGWVRFLRSAVAETSIHFTHLGEQRLLEHSISSIVCFWTYSICFKAKHGRQSIAKTSLGGFECGV